VPYATIDELAQWLTPEPAPDNAARLLEQASDTLDQALIGVCHNLNDPDTRDVLRRACVRQVQWMLERGDETGAQNDLQSMSAGPRSFTRRTVGTGAGSVPKVGPQAAAVLRTSGLLNIWPEVRG